ncbi:MFS transporter [Solibacillus sp. FSL K6-4121]|uniref:MFS transporter n=1 Tax=Solibacillus sp. FSL K6-4121 TaxID=2921505 RepID=UPI0030F7730D
MNIKVLYTITILIFTTVFGVRPITSLYADLLGATMWQISLITLAYSIGPLLIAVHIGRYVDRYGEKGPILFGSFGLLVATSLPFFTESIVGLICSQFLLGLSQIFAIVSLQNGIGKSADSGGRDKAIGLFSLFSSGGMLFGPLIAGNAADYWSFTIAFVALAVAPLICVILSLFLKKHHQQIDSKDNEEKTPFLEIVKQKDIRNTLLAGMIILSALDIFYVYFPLYAESIGLSASKIGFLLSVMAAGNIIARFYIGSVLKLLGRVNALAYCMLIGAFAYALVGFTTNFTVLFIFVLIIGCCLGITQPISIIITYNLAPKNQTAELLGIRLASNRLAQTLLPFIFANMSTIWGLGTIFGFKALLVAITAWNSRSIKEREEVTE